MHPSANSNVEGGPVNSISPFAPTNPEVYQSDNQSRGGGGAIISLPDMSDTNSGKKKRKVSRSSEKTSSNKKNNFLVQKQKSLTNIQEEATPTLQVVPKKGDSSNIKVVVRLRPLCDKEIEEDQFEIVQILDQKVRLLAQRHVVFTPNYRWSFSETLWKCST